jgi:hypothetical protein
VGVEFLRKPDNGRMTLVLDESAEPITSLWAHMETADLPTVIESLRVRERVLKRNVARDSGVWRPSDNTPRFIPTWGNGRSVKGWMV